MYSCIWTHTHPTHTYIPPPHTHTHPPTHTTLEKRRETGDFIAMYRASKGLKNLTDVCVGQQKYKDTKRNGKDMQEPKINTVFHTEA